MVPIPKSTDDMRLMRRRILRSSRKRFHVRPLLSGGRVAGAWPPAARVESWRMSRKGRRRVEAVLAVLGRTEERELGRVEERNLRWTDRMMFGDGRHADRFAIRHDASLGSNGRSMAMDGDGGEWRCRDQVGCLSRKLRFCTVFEECLSRSDGLSKAPSQGTKAAIKTFRLNIANITLLQHEFFVRILIL
jgi:hypothetical protein